MGLFGGERYYGLRGNKLNAAINIVAGLDFLYVIFCDSNWTCSNEPSFDSFPILKFVWLTRPSLFGYDQGVMGGLLTLPSFVAKFPEINTIIDPSDNQKTTIQGITVASYNLGCFIGAILTMWIGDILGRRKMILLGSSIVVVGAILQCTAFGLTHLIIGVRIHSGNN